jgi:predicted nuclease of predicted toxin-antitoxin system
MLAQLLADRGHDASHVYHHGEVALSDAAIWEIASQDGWTIVTKDRDFAELVSSGPPGPAVVWIRLGNCSNAALRDLVGAHWLRVVNRLARGDRLVELNERKS